MDSQPAGFEPARGNPIGFQVQRLNHSATTATGKLLLLNNFLFLFMQRSGADFLFDWSREPGVQGRLLAKKNHKALFFYKYEFRAVDKERFGLTFYFSGLKMTNLSL